MQFTYLLVDAMHKKAGDNQDGMTLLASAQLAGNPYENYWQYIPEGMRPKMHFYNYPITSNVSAADFPMNIIRNIYIPGIVLQLLTSRWPLQELLSLGS